MNNKISCLGVLFLIPYWVYTQPMQNLSLDEAYQFLESRYAVLKDAAILEDIYHKEIEILDIAKLPNLQLKAEGRLQSASTRLEVDESMQQPFSIDQPLYSLRTFAEAHYVLKDGGLNEVQKRLKAVDLQRDLQTVEVTRFALRERINQYVVGIILLREQSKLFGFTLQDLVTRKENVEASVEFGVMLPSEVTKMEVKELEIKAQENNLIYRLGGLIKSLSDLLGVELARDVELKLPDFPDAELIPAINRPETKLFEVQQQAILARSDLLEVALQPKLSAYAQAGLGYPNPLNILDNGIAPFGIIGLQLNWQITDWKKNKLDREVLTLQALKLENAQETFEFNMQSKEANYLSEINRLKAQIEFDKDIADLQGEILKQLAAQLDEGVITSADYVSQSNAELIARQNLLVNQTELLKTQLAFWNDRGAY